MGSKKKEAKLTAQKMEKKQLKIGIIII